MEHFFNGALLKYTQWGEFVLKTKYFAKIKTLQFWNKMLDLTSRIHLWIMQDHEKSMNTPAEIILPHCGLARAYIGGESELF